MLDRVFDNWCNEAAYLLNQATAAQIDKVAEEFVFAGPFFVLNMANGNPIIVETNSLQMEEGAHYLPASILKSVNQWVTPRPGSKVEVAAEIKQTIRDRLLGILFSQTFDIIDRGIGTAEDLNLGCQIALGFRKGPFDIMRELGEAEVQRIMQKFKKERPGFPQAQKSFSFYQDFQRFILTDEIDGMMVITICRPQALNALNDEITAEILKVLKANASRPEIRGFVLTGYGTRAFSAGADIGRFPQSLGNKEKAVHYARECAEVQLFLDRLDKPVVAAINGMALGGGLEIAIRCHSLVAVPNAFFQFPEITLGILPAIGGCVVPYRKWPQGAELFHQMICLAKSINANEALKIGMVSKLVADESDLIGAAIAEVKRLQGSIPRINQDRIQIPEIKIGDEPKAGNQILSKEAVAVTIRTIQAAAAAPKLSEALEIGYQGFGEIACTEAAREGITAFLEKRKPVYKK
jgi:enoyl-CoA hydratase/3-hydroxyacyl-CoA dehydrogenase